MDQKLVLTDSSRMTTGHGRVGQNRLLNGVEPHTTGCVRFDPVFSTLRISMNRLRFRFEPKREKNWTEPDFQTLTMTTASRNEGPNRSKPTTSRVATTKPTNTLRFSSSNGGSGTRSTSTSTSSNGSSNGSRSRSSNGSTSSGGTSSNGTSRSTSRSSNGSTSSGTTTNEGSRRVSSPQVCIWRVRMGGDDEKGTRMVRDGEKGPKQRQMHRLGPRYVFF